MPVVEFEVQDHVGVVRLNRPKARNALSPEVVVLLDRAWHEIRDNEDVRVAIVTGEGDKAFSAGADLGKLIPLLSGGKRPESEWDEMVLEDSGIVGRALLRDFDTVKPVIAAINGHAIAGGMELVQGTDIRVSVEDAKFGVQEVKWAIFPAGGSTVRLPLQLPYALAMELLLTGDLIDAAVAHHHGFVNHLVSPSELLPKAFEIAHRIAMNGPLAVTAIRQSTRRCIGLTEVEGLQVETELARPIFKTKDAKEGPKAFMEKRTPIYHGR